MEDQGKWQNLSNDILTLILQRLHTQSDLCRFRSICKSWRSFASLTLTLTPPLFPLQLPSFHPNSRHFCLYPSFIYLLSPSSHSTPHNPNNIWLVKVSETSNNRWTLLNPLTNQKLYFPSGVFPNRINLLGFKNLEVGRSYRLQLVGDFGEDTFNFEEFSSSIVLRKVVIQIYDEFVALALYGYGEIALWKFGDKKWKIIACGKDEKEKENHFDDAIYYKGKFYAIDRSCRLVVIDPTTFELTEIVAPMEDCNYQYTYLVECDYRLYLVNKIVNPWPVNYYDEEEEEWVIDKTSFGRPIGFKIFTFNEREKSWERVRSLGERVFFVSRDTAFSIRAEDLGWSKGNCIYFEGLTGYDDEADMGFGLNAGVYTLEDDVVSTFTSIMDPQIRIFRPPSNLFLQGEDYQECEMQDYSFL